MADEERVNVGIVDDDPFVRSALHDLLRSRRDLVVVFMAADGLQAIAEAGRTQPDVILMDIRMPTMDGITAALRIRSEYPAIKVLLMTSLDVEGDLPAAIRSGASGMILKTSPLQALADQIRAVHYGGTVWSAEPFRWWVSQHREAAMASAAAGELEAPLTDREHEILRLLSHASTNREIANALDISESTVKTHVSAIMAKLGVTTRLKAVIRASELGL